MRCQEPAGRLWGPVVLLHTQVMGDNTFRYQEGERPASTYWRRRFFALAGGLAGFALLAWSVSGAIGGVSVISPAANVVNGHQHRPAGGGARPAGPAPAKVPQHSATPSPQPSGSVSQHHASPRPASKATRPARRKGPARPKRKTCAFNVGAASLALVIKAGSVRVWSSADCLQGRKSLLTDLVKGVPTMLSFGWDRRTSSPGCKLASSAVPAGIYSATAVSGKIISNREIFRIR